MSALDNCRFLFLYKVNDELIAAEDMPTAIQTWRDAALLTEDQEPERIVFKGAVVVASEAK